MEAYCASATWKQDLFRKGDFSACLEDSLLGLVPLVFLFIFGTYHLCKIRNVFGPVQLTPGTQHTCTPYFDQRSSALWEDSFLDDMGDSLVDEALYAHWKGKRRSGVDWLLVALSFLVASAPIVELALRCLREDLADPHPYQVVFGVCNGIAWLYCTAILAFKSSGRRGLPTHVSLRLFFCISLLLASVKLRSVILEVWDGQAISLRLGIFIGVFTGYFLITFVGICFEGGYNYSPSTSAVNSSVAVSHEQAMQQPLLDDEMEPDQPLRPCKACDGLQECPEVYAGLLSRISFWWMNKLIRAGNQHPLTMEDLPPIHYQDRTRTVDNSFKETWEAENLQLHPSLTRALFKAFGGWFVLAGFFKVLYDSLTFVSPQLLHALTTYLADTGDVSPETPSYYGYLYTAGMFAQASLSTIILHQYFHLCFRTGMHVRGALIAAIYRKALKLTGSAREEKTTGEIVNLMSTDAMRLQDLFPYLHIAWSGPYQIILAIYFLYQQLGAAVFVGVAVMLLFMLPVNIALARIVKKVQRDLMQIKDTRVKVTNETLGSMKIVKLYAWELSFEEKITKIREEELRLLTKYQYMSIIMTVMWGAIPIIVSVCTFGVYVSIKGNELTAAKAFTALALFNILRFPMAMFPRVVNNIVEAGVSVKRLFDFLTSAEIDDFARAKAVLADATLPRGAIVIEEGTYYWDDNMSKQALKDLNLNIAPKKLVVVCGRTGAGKSALLSSFIGELPTSTARMAVVGSVAYTAQVAWIQNATVRENILFGAPYEPEWYRKVIHACALEADLDILPAGDQTEIGSKGINLSGGQKQRVALARAVYMRADIYLLDDTLSAVDAHVGLHILEKCILGLLKDKTRIFVTHNVNILPKADHIVVLSDGCVKASGTYEKLKRSGIDFRKVTEVEKQPEDAETDESALEDIRSPSLGRRSVRSSEEDAVEDKQLSEVRLSNKRASVNGEGGKQDETKGGKDKGKLIDEEERRVGSVSLGVYRDYMAAAGGSIVVILILGTYILEMGANLANSRWLAYWSDHISLHKSSYYLGFYILISVADIFLITFSRAALLLGGLRAARRIHTRMLKAVMRAPMWIFDTTPLGRILNRFSKDQYTVDEKLPSTFASFLSTFFSVIGVIVIIACVVPMFLAVFAPVYLIYHFTQNYYIKTSRELQRWDSVLRSPIYSHFSETLEGVDSIRAFGAQDRFIQLNEEGVDKSLQAYYPSIASNRWLAFRLEFLGTIISTSAAGLVVYFRHKLATDPGLGALAVSYALNVTQALNWMVRMTSDRETNIVSVERCTEYASLPSEAPFESAPERAPPANWPSRGRITFSGLKLRYRPELDLVLKGLDCTIEAGEKVGVVGRTGAGKSSLLLALLRLVEAAEGTIHIDDVDIRGIGLHDLRSRLSIIPQEPVLFTGTVRFNLDPFKSRSDERIWEALRLSHLADHIRSLPLGLDHEVTEGGANFSMGQRQLLCLARALLRDTKLIQETIRTAFKDCTTLTIAHRLDTVLDSSKVMVLSQGEIVEYDSPTALLSKPGGAFASIVKAAEDAAVR